MFLKELESNFFSSDNKITQIWERGKERETERGRWEGREREELGGEIVIRKKIKLHYSQRD